MNELFEIPDWLKYGYYSKEAFDHYLNRQQKLFLGHLRTFKTWRDYYSLRQIFYTYDTQKHCNLFHPWRKQLFVEL